MIIRLYDLMISFFWRVVLGLVSSSLNGLFFFESYRYCVCLLGCRWLEGGGMAVCFAW